MSGELIGALVSVSVRPARGGDRIDVAPLND
jgi:hypothetical protein